MSYQILVADDSLTVQKVIKMTLTHARFELEQVYSELELLERIQKNNFDLILLDFSLGEGRDAYELSHMIKEKMPKAKILVMLGAFDFIDESLFAQSEIDDRIIKPFESDLIIQKCENLIENNVENHPDADWEILGSQQEGTQVSRMNSLEKEIQGWGMEIPASIDGGKGEAIMPRPIGEESEEEKEILSVMPNKEDLEYPSLGEDHEVGNQEFLDEMGANKVWDIDADLQMASPGENHSDQDQVIEKLKEAMTPIVEKAVKEYALKKVEEIAWKIIPDLAENLISEELQNLSNESSR